MTVIRSDVLGFCMGVRRAVEIARSTGTAAAAAPAFKVFTLGPLIHNPRVLDELKNLGIESREELPDDLQGFILIIRAHGIGPQMEQALIKRGAMLIDASCPNVKKSQLTAEEFEKNGFRLFIAGEAGHAEISALKAYAPSGIIVGNPDEAEIAAHHLFETDPRAKTALLAQTTIDEEEYHTIGDIIKKYFPATEIAHTICSATRERQNSLRHLLKKVDAVIVAGGKTSANTRRLAVIAAERGIPHVLAESASDIPPEFYKYDNIGISAGASTPDNVIEEIMQALTRN